MAKQTLSGLTIAVTRPRDQARKLAQQIEQAGGRPLLFPLLDIAEVQDTKILHEQVARLAQFDLAIFISPNAVQFGMAAIGAAGVSLTAPSVATGFACAGGKRELKIATVGQGSARALRELGVAHVLAPSQRFDSEGLLALPELQNVAGWRVMIFRGDGGRELLGDTLRARGATVEYVTCYRRSRTQQDVRTLLNAGPDAITVTSSEALKHLREILGEGARTLLRDVPIFVPHARIAELAVQQGWQHVQLTGFGDGELLSALRAWAGQKTEAPARGTPVGAPPQSGDPSADRGQKTE